VYTYFVDSDTIEIFLIGDAGEGGEDQEMTASWMKQYKQANPIAFVLMLGDNFYENGVLSEYDPLFFTNFELVYNGNLTNTFFYAILGNHDYRGNVEAQLLYSKKSKRWKMPFICYNFIYYLKDMAKIEFIGLDACVITAQTDFTDTEIDWFTRVLAESDADWKIVYGHYPLYSNGEHGNSYTMINEIEPLLEEYSVDMYISGHEHDLQVLKETNGIYYLISGSAGKCRPTDVAGNTLYANGAFGFMTLKISNSSIIVRVIIEDAVVDYELVIEK
jgi:predicted phosphodiesterase